MPLSVTDVEILKDYIDGVMRRADHHANEVEEIALALTGAILWKKDDGKDIRVMEKSGDTKNVLWVTIGGQQYAFAYNHAAKTIEMRQGNMRGVVLHSFSNAMRSRRFTRSLHSYKVAHISGTVHEVRQLDAHFSSAPTSVAEIRRAHVLGFADGFAHIVEHRPDG